MNCEYALEVKKWSRIQNGKFKILEATLIQWFREMIAFNFSLSNDLFQGKTALSLTMKIEIF